MREPLSGMPVSPWLGRSREPGHPPVDRHIETELLVIGGGIAGVSTAYELLRLGAEVTLVEAERISSATTGNSSAKLSALQGAVYAQLSEDHDLATARSYARLNLEGLKSIRKIADEVSIGCSLSEKTATSFAMTNDGVRRLENEEKAARKAGLQVTMTEHSDLPFLTKASLNLDGQAQFDPVAWTRGVADWIAANGGSVHENTRIVDIPYENMARTDGGETISFEKLVTATHLPSFDRGPLSSVVVPSRTFVLAGTLDGSPPQGMYLSVDEEVWSLRPLLAREDREGRELLLVGGMARPVGTDSAREAFLGLEAFFRGSFPVTAITNRWSAHDHISQDRLPIFGRVPWATGNQWVTTGYSKWGLAAAVGASAVIAQQIVNGAAEENRYSPARWARPTTLAKRLAPIAKAVRHLLIDRLPIVGTGEQGAEPELDLTCTHMGCKVRWNDAEENWECPCHGSVFEADGSILRGPATKPLSRKHRR